MRLYAIEDKKQHGNANVGGNLRTTREEGTTESIATRYNFIVNPTRQK